ncbi:hypothetical protein [Sporosarcina psychrophila]|uniref:hypothetical protein n=1 Tax=Sporosarcina psychrophila TaxID=1476 RepID=UPI00078CE771|nr:hypothetical protein [Sporosarcina psychrophila]AMQ07808.1 hypothetical protein AZE41_18705 [Sporosarcina psychrophila]
MSGSRYAISKKVDFINLSLGGTNSSAIENEVIQRAVRVGIVIVIVADNNALKEVLFLSCII